jgi:hypothetical protein
MMGEARMSEFDSGSRDRPQEHKAHRTFDDKIQYLSGAEEQLLQSISVRAPLPEVLNGICIALDCQIGNVVSLILLPGDDAGDLAAIAMNAALFGLYTFWSEAVVAENGELLGALEMYCCIPRSPSAGEFQLIERARCLAALAIKLENEADRQSDCGPRGNRPVRASVLEWPVSAD